MPPTRIAIHGAAGRMGCRLIVLATQNPLLQIVAAVESEDHPRMGVDAGFVAGIGEIGIPITSRLRDEAELDVVVDFSVPRGAVAIADQCAERGIPLVVATTGISDGQRAAIAAAAERIPIVWAPNMSLAVNLSIQLAEFAAEVLANHPAGVDVEIIEWHHRYKEDAPSGTAYRLGEVIASKMGQSVQQHGRCGRPGQRPRNEIGYHAVRAGDHPGEHRILFGMPGESLEIRVGATSRDCYAEGALMAAQWIVRKPAGLYGMREVLGL
ncbi:MAG: 4-hydroxy-tetrahydrodipicolinate reductase [Pirellulales bacterium]|nr:4-hydroxy-tetrahydrodipicolinate reductase [Pirellulales bacterium]